jgi:hypothetical protein
MIPLEAPIEGLKRKDRKVHLGKVPPEPGFVPGLKEPAGKKSGPSLARPDRRACYL